MDGLASCPTGRRKTDKFDSDLHFYFVLSGSILNDSSRTDIIYTRVVYLQIITPFIKQLSHYARSHWSISVFRLEYVNAVVTL